MNLNTYLSNCLNYNPQNWKCSVCENIQRDCEKEFIYCQCNNVFCPGCFKTHHKKVKGEHKFTIQSNKFNLRCKKSKDHYEEVYKGYCYECKTHYCQKCENEHKWHEKVDIKTMQIQEKEVDKIKEINKEYERLISYYKGMIQLNKLIMYSHKNCRDNYYNLNNINTIIKNDKRNEILNTLNDKENGAIIPGEEDSNITNYMNELYQQNIDSEINKISISNKFFNNYDLRVLVQMPLKYLRFLDLENNSISQIDCLKKSDFANLVILNLNNNAIKDILPLENASFKDNLQALFLRNNCIKDISVFKKKCASLRQLDLRNNCIDDISVFDSMKDYLANLQSLYLANNAFDKNQFENAIKNINELTEKDIE
jgi:hypothetical protein